ncbi:cupin domain-containing protein [Helicobacter rodentium]|uniref:cupin domain-containing protein n=2 Tax=Helicobacter rodentium TaxID=59617 RepID=UPI0023555FFF|nr:cupin domain-containing protein [Helicobacter rodentium]
MRKHSEIFQFMQIRHCEAILSAICMIEKNKTKSVFVTNEKNQIIGILVDGDIRRWLIQNPNLHIQDESIKDHFAFKNFSYIFDDEFCFDKLNKIFTTNKIEIIPILNREKKLINFLTKDNFHFLLLNNLTLKPNFKFYQISQNNQAIHSRPWGFYKSLLLTNNVQSKIITLFPKQMISLQKHTKREEHWVVVYGKGNIILEDSTIKAYTGKYVFIPKGCKHRIINTSANQNLIFCEVQLGNYFGEDDIIRYEDKYNRR